MVQHFVATLMDVKNQIAGSFSLSSTHHVPVEPNRRGDEVFCTGGVSHTTPVGNKVAPAPP